MNGLSGEPSKVFFLGLHLLSLNWLDLHFVFLPAFIVREYQFTSSHHLHCYHYLYRYHHRLTIVITYPTLCFVTITTRIICEHSSCIFGGNRAESVFYSGTGFRNLHPITHVCCEQQKVLVEEVGLLINI